MVLFLMSLKPAYPVMTPAEKNYILGPEDVIEIRVWENDDLNRTVEISKEGTFTFPLIGQVQAAGLSVFDLEKLIKKRLSDGYLVAPQVTVSVVQYRSQKVYLLGEVVKPGRYTLKGQTHLLELISEAGGLTERAGKIVTIVRPRKKGYAKPVSLNDTSNCDVINVNLDDITSAVTDNLYIMNGDTIYVREAPGFYVTGEVVKPGEFRWKKGITVRQAISLAGGPTNRGAIKRSKIIRTVNGKEVKIQPDLNDPVMPDDIINVPESYF